MYNNYIDYLKQNDLNQLVSSNFKSNNTYNGILEHVSYDLGLKYLNFIKTEFINITYNDIIGFVNINDKYGEPNKKRYIFDEKEVICSPTTIRYIYHALIILDYYKTTQCTNIVEIGCGYGGLCLCINYFSKLNNISITNYNIIDFPEVCDLIKNYLNLNSEFIHTNNIFHSSYTYGENVKDTNLFFISNYCYTEIEKIHNEKYTSIVLSKTTNGFIIWQNGGNQGSYPVEKADEITNKRIVKYIEEKPQTDAGYGIYKNYFVYF
jgi:hypothetical protein